VRLSALNENTHDKKRIVIMSDALTKLRAAQAALKAQTDKQKQNNGPSELFRHWNLDFDKSCTFRFLPDGDESNVFFWKKKMLWEWKFPTAEGTEVKIVMPCKKTFDPAAKCEVYSLLGDMFSLSKKTGDQSHAGSAKAYWVKTSFLMQGFVRYSDYKEEQVPESLIRKFDFTKDVFQDTIENRVQDTNPDTCLKSWPVDFENGLNYVVKKTQGSNGYANYRGSSFGSNPSALSEEERAAISGGVPSLARYLPTQLTDEAYGLQMTMLETALSGGVWNKEWEDAGFKPYIQDDRNSETGEGEAPAAPKAPIARVSAMASQPAEPEAAAAPAAAATSNDMAERAARIKEQITKNRSQAG
jgi:hypothetical protein